MTEIEQRVIKVAWQLAGLSQVVKPNLLLTLDQLQFDSLDVVEFAMCLEDEFKVEVEEGEDFTKDTRLLDIVGLIRLKLMEKNK